VNRREGWRPAGRVHADRQREIEDELRLHIEGRVAEYVATGMDEGQARRRAEARFGDMETVAAACRASGPEPDARGRRGGGMTMEQWIQDVRLALRGLRRRPTFTGAALITVALAVGATTGVYSVVSGVLLSPLPHPDPQELALIWEVDQRESPAQEHNPVTVATFHDWRTQSRSFESMAGFGIFPMTVRTEEGPESVLGGVVTADFFRVLEVDAALGRTFLPEEDQPGLNQTVVVISHEYWQSRFGGDPDILGKRVTPTSEREVVGVLPPDFEFMDEHPRFFVPYGLDPETLANRRSHTLNVVGRLADGVGLEAAQAEMDRITEGLTIEYPEELTGFGVNVESMARHVVGPVRQALLVLLAAVGFVLLIACVNVANLMLTRSLTEHRQDAVRAAVGASRARLLQQRLTEALVLALVGGALGVGLAAVATRALAAAAPEGLPRADQVGLDGGVLGFALVLTVIVGLAFGLLPALRAARSDLAADLREGSRSVSGARGQQRIRTGFAVAQITLSLVLLVSAGLMIHTFARLTRVDPGFEPGGVLTASVTLTDPADSTRARQAAKLDAILAQVRSLPGVDRAGVTKFLPFDQGEWTWSVVIEGKPPPPEGEKLDYGLHAVSEGYFRTMGIPLLSGRDVEATDRDGTSRVALVNQAFVRRFFDEGEVPVGRRFALAALPEDFMEIVGVVGDTHHHQLDREPVPAFYLPYDQVPYDWFIGDMSVAARTASPTNLVPSLRRALRDVDPDLLVGEMVTMEARISRSVARRRFALVLLTTFAVAALTIAVVGIYGLMAYAVGQRRQEIGVRIALGARPEALVARFVGNGLKLVMVGVVLGLIGAAAFARLQASLLYGVEPVDLATYAVVAAVLVAAAVVATWLPARRAARIDPVEVLSSD
jgi:putative ABC transport system permease protein